MKNVIILNEKEYVDNILKNKTVEPSKIYAFLTIYARYLYHEKNMGKAEILKELDLFMKENFPNYNSVEWNTRLESYAKKAEKYPLCKCSGIWITKEEIQTICELHDKVLERLAFTLLCLAKYNNFRNPDNNSWIHYSNGEIFSMACICTPAMEKDIKISKLRELGLIQFARKINNLNIRVCYAATQGEETLFISDFRALGNEWRLYKGEDYIRCAMCGILTKKKKGTSKYCCTCRKRSASEKARLRVARYRGKCNASQKIL